MQVGKRPTPLIVTYVGAILLKEGALLLGRRAAHRSYPDCWDIVGGHVEAGETIEQTLVREVEEEIGVTPVQCAKLTSLHAEGIELHIYRVDAWSGGTPALHGDEHVELRWFTVDAACALPNLATAEYVQVFRELGAAT
jgi:8-oxo-dGTP diphosphatase